MIRWVVEGVKPPDDRYRVFVATDDLRIKDVLKDYDYCKVLLSDIPFRNGTERVYWASKQIDPADIIINLQGDEPLINFEIIEKLAIGTIDSIDGFATLSSFISHEHEINNPNIVKLILSNNDYALYFSRYPIPYNRDNNTGYRYKKHIGIYGFTSKALEIFASLKESGLENMEKLEQLRILENNYKIKVINIQNKLIGIDTLEDVKKVENYLKYSLEGV